MMLVARLTQGNKKAQQPECFEEFTLLFRAEIGRTLSELILFNGIVLFCVFCYVSLFPI